MRTELILHEYCKVEGELDLAEPIATVKITFETEGHGDDITIVNRITNYILNEICRKSGGAWSVWREKR